MRDAKGRFLPGNPEAAAGGRARAKKLTRRPVRLLLKHDLADWRKLAQDSAFRQASPFL